MSYDELISWRGLAQGIPKTVLNPLNRLVIITLITYESSDKGAFFKPENISNELGITYRAVLDNFHYLGDGLVWRGGKRIPCSNLACKDHLGIIKTAYYARSGKAQNYRLDMKAIERLSSMNSGSPINESMNLDDLEHEPEHVEHEPEHELARTVVHPYKHNKQFNKLINTDSDYWYQLIELVPGKKKFAHTPEILELLSKLKHKGTSFKVIRDAIETIPWHSVNNPSGWIAKLLRDLETRPPIYDMENKPTWCRKCDELTRRLNEPVAIPNGNGATTFDCIDCHPAMVNKRLGN
jgi:hypothetical protein